MNKDFMIVHKSILPDYFEKVIEAREMLERLEVRTVTEAVKRTGISRNTYYKYKDFIYPFVSDRAVRKAVFSLILKDEAGVLTSVLKTVSDHEASILTISQAVPIHAKANVLLSLDISKMTKTLEELRIDLTKLKDVTSVHLDAVE